MSAESEIDLLPFLDIEHILTGANKKFFLHQKFYKATAINSTFLNGKPFIQLNIFKGIFKVKKKRMKRINKENKINMRV